MALKTWYKTAIIILIVIGTGGIIYYFNLSNRHKAIVKTQLLHFFNVIDSDWDQTLSDKSLTLESPALLIDNIYKSMEGPKALEYFYFDKSNPQLFWMTNFKVSAKNLANKTISNDFICHMNINYIEQEHHGRWHLLDRINMQFPRLISLSHGVESISFPDGFGFPFFGDEQFFITTETLNHNVKDSIFQVKHDISIGYTAKKLKPLMPRTIFMQLPFDINKLDDADINDIEPNSCIPVETKNLTYFNKKGQILSGHWKINKGKQVFTCNVTKQLSLKDTLRLHQITPHLHPFAEQFTLKDLTTNEILYNCIVTNHRNRVGLSDTPVFSSKEGVLMFPDHIYELILTTNNTSDEIQDMMASMFLFFYDKEMAVKTKNYLNVN
ncbi:hypothetical protein [Snuella lapsa]|uniref:Uncharacterized protein n=1 Tax=Snuella lapsa TaxID=870481 RepID=A0ABP6XJ24_9FLAO